MRIRTLAASGVAAVAALLLAAGPASAATQRFDFPQQCYDLGGGYTLCESSSGQSNTAQTPSGNYNSTGKGASTFSIVGPGYDYSSGLDYKFGVHYQQGELHQYRAQSTDVVTFNGQTCTYGTNLVFANGEIRHDKPTLDCTS